VGGQFPIVNFRKLATLISPLAIRSFRVSSDSVLVWRGNYRPGVWPAAFCNRATYYVAELNAIHPFRDGNGRTQREFIRQLAARHGYFLDWSSIQREQMIQASQDSFARGNNAGLEQILQRALTKT
jgi:fido (protein-threonine AMPylation protein)